MLSGGQNVYVTVPLMQLLVTISFIIFNGDVEWVVQTVLGLKKIRPTCNSVCVPITVMINLAWSVAVDVAGGRIVYKLV